MNLFMPGIWRHTITVETGAGPAEQTEFFFCVQG
jgi:hypothetical protein